MSSRQFQFNQQIEALLAGPLVSDQVLHDRLQALAPHAQAVYGVVTNLHQVARAAEWLDNLELGIVIAPVAYPLGNLPWEIKALQARLALDAGARCLDFVLPIEHLKAGLPDPVVEEVAAMSALSAEYQVRLTCIAPLALLTPVEAMLAARICHAHGTALKTATGLGTDTSLDGLRGLTRSWSAAYPDTALDVIACGEISLFEQAQDLLQAGAVRVCTPAPEAIFAGEAVLQAHNLLEAKQ